jgi:NAD(P)H-hydrate epimerase
MITIKQMRELERKAVAHGIIPQELMENAGKKVYQLIKERFDLNTKRVVIFVGQGNNGGDGLVAARYLSHDCPVIILFFGEKDDLSEESFNNYERVKNKVNIIKITEKKDLELFHLQKNKEYLFIDALLGIGVQGKIKEPIATAIDHFNSLSGIKISIDVPSGINADTGIIEDKACYSDLIITMHDIKMGLEKFKEKTVVVDIGIPN